MNTQELEAIGRIICDVVDSLKITADDLEDEPLGLRGFWHGFALADEVMTELEYAGYRIIKV
jgi:hypothetical protein